jgi:hypothetical protein
MKTRLMFTLVLLFTTAFAGCRSTQRYTPIDTSSHSTPARSTGQWGGQKTCPVTGEALGSMGDPIAVKVQGHTVWVCCEGCADAVKNDPEKSLQYVQKERGRTPGTAIRLDDSYDPSNSSRVSSSSGSCSSCRSR